MSVVYIAVVDVIVLSSDKQQGSKMQFTALLVFHSQNYNQPQKTHHYFLNRD
jgi:hypothetical protein